METNSRVAAGAGAAPASASWMARARASAAVTNAIGRTSLWSATVFLFAAALGVATSMAWLLTPLGRAPSFLRLHAAVVSIAIGAGWVLFLNLELLYRFFVPHRDVSYRSLAGARIHVALTAYDDEASIGLAVRDFKASPIPARVIVVDNNSSDRTREVAREAGADAVVVEEMPGYGSCCMRALEEAAEGADAIVLCEGDMTFSSRDLPKLIAYLENCDLVLGTRATQELRQPGSQMDWLINPANQIVAKLHQLRFFGTRLTDVGCTYRALRVDAYRQLAPKLSVRGSHFSPHMFIEALKMQMRVIEIPILFRRRVGVSKGVGNDKWKAAKVALAMLRRLYVA